jgi:hypothetical protein
MPLKFIQPVANRKVAAKYFLSFYT